MISWQKRVKVSKMRTVATYVGAILIGLVAAALLIASTGADVRQVFSALLQGAFGSPKALASTLVKATPLILTGLAAMIAFRAQLWSIGQEGQVVGGAMGAYLGVQMLGEMPSYLLIPGALLIGLAAGVALGWVAGVLRNRFSVNEIISTVMLNYLVVYFLSWLLQGGPWGERGGTVSYHQSPTLPGTAFMPHIGDSRLHVAVALPFLLAAACAWVVARTPFGLEVRGLGLNAEALRHKGVDIRKTALAVLMISGAFAALAGAIELLAVGHRLRADSLVGLGYAGIIVAMIGGLTPWGTVVAGVFFGGLASGAVYMRVLGDVPAALVPAIQGIMLFLILGASVSARYSIRWGAAR
ncbi:ABC transporter permease [Ensifer sp. ENS07]|nr:ABC transporter permease [Ensifer sp. ENS07]